MRRFLTLAAAGLIGLADAASAQQSGTSVFAEIRGGAVVPTFDIADVAKTGESFGASLGVQLNPRWSVIGEFDYGMHKDKSTGTVDINTLHFVAKVGYSLTGPRDRGLETALTLGVGSVGFDVDGAAETFSYFAINAGAKLAWYFSPRLALVLSPQGDIAFSKEDELTTTNAWVWPMTAGLRVRF